MSQHSHNWSQTSKWVKGTASNVITHYPQAKDTILLSSLTKSIEPIHTKKIYQITWTQVFLLPADDPGNGAGRSEVGYLTHPWKSCWARSEWNNLFEDRTSYDLTTQNSHPSDYTLPAQPVIVHSSNILCQVNTLSHFAQEPIQSRASRKLTLRTKDTNSAATKPSFFILSYL